MVTRKKPAAKKKPAPAKRKPLKPLKPVKVGTSKEAAHARKLLFVEGMLAHDGNITAAAKAAGFSARSAAQQGSRLLKDAKVQQLLKDRRGALLAKLELTTEGVLRNLAQSVYFDPRKLFKPDGSALLPHELDDDTAAALTGVEFEVDGKGKVISAKYKAAEKNTARDQAMKHLGMFKADNTQRTLLGDVPRDRLKALVARLAGG